MTWHLLIDTCTWLDLGKDYRERPLVGALEHLAKSGTVRLDVPQLVLDEFHRNKARVIADAQRSLQSHFRAVREAVNRYGEDDTKSDTLKALNEIDHKIALKSEAVIDSMARIEALLASVAPISLSASIKERVTDRSLRGLAPCHRGRNSAADGAILEHYVDLLSEVQNEPCCFVTHNTQDFSELNGDRRKPHADLTPLFTSPGSQYSVSLADVIREIDPALLDDEDFEFNYSQEPRRLSELLEAEHLLFRQVWYNRHWNLRSEIEEGRHFVVPEKDYARDPYRQDQTLDTVWARALAAAERTEKELGPDNFGPWDDFEWGMINGKLSALRWVLGDEWDMLDT